MPTKIVKGWKLFRKMKNGEIKPLFINARHALPMNKWLPAECHPTKGFAVRPGWHAATQPIAPHLSKKNRVWMPVELQGVKRYSRPESQGGVWLLAKRMRIVEA
jgi:hypothetical protein